MELRSPSFVCSLFFGGFRLILSRHESPSTTAVMETERHRSSIACKFKSRRKPADKGCIHAVALPGPPPTARSTKEKQCSSSSVSSSRWAVFSACSSPTAATYTLLIWTGGSTPLLCLEGVPDLPVAPQ